MSYANNIIVQPIDTKGSGGWFADVTYTGVKLSPSNPPNYDKYTINDDDLVYALCSNYNPNNQGDANAPAFFSYVFGYYNCPGVNECSSVHGGQPVPISAYGVLTNFYVQDIGVSLDTDCGIYTYYFSAEGYWIKYNYNYGTSYTYSCDLAQNYTNTPLQVDNVQGVILSGTWKSVKAFVDFVYPPGCSPPVYDPPRDPIIVVIEKVVKQSNCYEYPNNTNDPNNPPPDPRVEKTTWTCYGYKLNDQNKNSIWKFDTTHLYTSTLSFTPTPCPSPNPYDFYYISNVNFYYVGDTCPDGTICCTDQRGNMCCIDCCALGSWVLNNVQTYML